MTSISHSQIKYVIALEKTGSFSEAAERCFVTQSTLSTMIKKLENHIDLKLFDRQKKPIELTAEGKKLINQFKIIENEYENLFDLTNTTKGEFHGTLKIGVIPTIAPFLLPLFLEKVTSKYPHLNLEIYEITTHEVQNRLKLREIDLGLISIPIGDSELNQISLFKEEFLVYDAREQEQVSKRYKIDDIDISNLWLLEESHCMTSQIGKICLKNYLIIIKISSKQRLKYAE
jgi:LysR family hydrogen peroxide-inducible transcriptional activator